jgi:hypothetical protein
MEVTTRSEGELCEKLKLIGLKGSGVQPYLNTLISIETINPARLSPCQRYVLLPELRKIEQLRWEIEKEYGWDILRLNGYLKVSYPPARTSHGVYIDFGDTVIDILPPVVEEYFTPFGELQMKINDGMHRVYLAYQMGIPINVAYVRGVTDFHPYYAHSLPRGFDDVEIREDLPEGYCKKFHVAKEHKRLFRDFNTQFSNIGESRPYSSKETT